MLVHVAAKVPPVAPARAGSPRTGTHVLTALEAPVERAQLLERRQPPAGARARASHGEPTVCSRRAGARAASPRRRAQARARAPGEAARAGSDRRAARRRARARSPCCPTRPRAGSRTRARDGARGVGPSDRVAREPAHDESAARWPRREFRLRSHRRQRGVRRRTRRAGRRQGGRLWLLTLNRRIFIVPQARASGIPSCVAPPPPLPPPPAAAPRRRRTVKSDGVCTRPVILWPSLPCATPHQSRQRRRRGRPNLRRLRSGASAAALAPGSPRRARRRVRAAASRVK